MGAKEQAEKLQQFEEQLKQQEEVRALSCGCAIGKSHN